MATLASTSALLNRPQGLVARTGPQPRSPRHHDLPVRVTLLSPTRAAEVSKRQVQRLSDVGRSRGEGSAAEAGPLKRWDPIHGALVGFVRENARELAVGSLVLALLCLPDERALALGPGGPVAEEFWDNVRRYGFYFFTVVSGGLYSLAKPLVDLLKNPSTQLLVLVAVVGSLYLVYLTVSTMLGLNDFQYQYAQ